MVSPISQPELKGRAHPGLFSGLSIKLSPSDKRKVFRITSASSQSNQTDIGPYGGNLRPRFTRKRSVMNKNDSQLSLPHFDPTYSARGTF